MPKPIFFQFSDDLAYIWTSGRLCNFKGCDRDDLQPVNVNGWFWSGSGVKMAPTNSTPPGWSYQPWSDTGHKTQFNNGVKVAQPDNAEFEINGSVEACMVTILPRNSSFPLEISKKILGVFSLLLGKNRIIFFFET